MIADGGAVAAPARKKHIRLLGRDTRVELVVGVAVVAATSILPLATGSLYWGQVFLLANVYLIAAISLNILRGEAGQISFGQGAIFGASAYATGMAAGLYDVHIVPAMCIGVAAALVFGVLLALPALRVQGYYLAFVTVAAARRLSRHPPRLRRGHARGHRHLGVRSAGRRDGDLGNGLGRDRHSRRRDRCPPRACADPLVSLRPSNASGRGKPRGSAEPWHQSRATCELQLSRSRRSEPG